MKTGIRLIVAGLCLAAVSSVFGAVDEQDQAPRPDAPPASAEERQAIVTEKTTLSADELARYQRLEQVSEEKAREQAAGEGMDKSTIVIIAVLAVVVIVAAASGGGGGGGY